MRNCAGVVDVCLIPEVKFDLDGPQGLMAYIEKLLTERDHCVICVAEGAGQVTFQRHQLHLQSFMTLYCCH